MLTLIATSGFSIVAPNQAKVITFLGRYLGTISANGFRWTFPLTMRRTVSLRIQNFDSNTLKVNDAMGNPVEVAAVIVWRVVDSAKAVFEIEDYQSFVQIQTETAVRHMASMYPYDSYEPGQTSLQANAEEVMAQLHRELQEQLSQAGVEVFGPSCAGWPTPRRSPSEMLRRQQAEAVVAARRRIVEGAVGMVDHGTGAAIPAKDRRAGRGAQGGDGLQPAGSAVQRVPHPAGGQHRNAVLVAGSQRSDRARGYE